MTLAENNHLFTIRLQRPAARGLSAAARQFIGQSTAARKASGPSTMARQARVLGTAARYHSSVGEVIQIF